MPEQSPRKPRLDNFASFDAAALQSSGRRRSTWSLRPTEEPGERLTADAARFLDRGALYAGLSRKAGKE
jgi:hypothetical protein